MLGLIVGVCIALPVGVVADSLVGAKIETVVKVKLDGEYLPVDAIGLKGTTYAPVRALSEALGKEVAWVNGEVTIKSPDEKSEEYEQEKFDDEYIEALEVTIEVKKNTLSTLKYLLEVDIENGADEGTIQKQRDDIANLEKHIAELEKKLSELKGQATE